MISTNNGVTCSQIFVAIFQALSDGCLIIIEPICKNVDASDTSSVVYRVGAGECFVSAAIIAVGEANSDQTVNGMHAFWVSSSSHAIPQLSSVSSCSRTVVIPRRVFWVYHLLSSSVVR